MDSNAQDVHSKPERYIVKDTGKDILYPFYMHYFVAYYYNEYQLHVT